MQPLSCPFLGKQFSVEIEDMRSVRAAMGANPCSRRGARRRRFQRVGVHSGSGCRLVDESGHQRSSNTLVTPRSHDVNPADTAHVRTPGKGITVKASHCDQQTLVQMAAQGFARSIKAVPGARPLVHQGVNKVVALIPRLRLQTLQARTGSSIFRIEIISIPAYL